MGGRAFPVDQVGGLGQGEQHQLVGREAVEIAEAVDANDFMEQLLAQEFDCLVLEAELPVDLSEIDRAC